MGLHSIKPTPEMDLARGAATWFHDCEAFVAGMERASLSSHDRQRLDAALLVLNDHRERIEKLLKPKGDDQ